MRGENMKCENCGGELKINEKLRKKLTEDGLYNKKFWKNTCDECFKVNYCPASGEDHCGWEMPNGDSKCLDCGAMM